MESSNKFYHFLKDNKGSTPVIMICVSIIIILAAALLTDIGYAALERFKLERNAAGVAEEGAEILANDRDKAIEYMKLSAVRKVNDLNALDIMVSDDNREITVSMGKPFEYIFLSLLRFEGKDIKASVTAKLSGINAYKGLKPLGVARESLVFGKRITLSDIQSPGSDMTNVLPIDFGGGSFKTDVVYGNRKLVQIGDKVGTLGKNTAAQVNDGIGGLIKKCKHQPACTYDSFVKGCSRIIVLPVVEKAGGADTDFVSVIGFAAFFIEDCSTDRSHISITGRFIKYTVKSDTNDGAADFGLLGVRLIR